MLHCVLRSSFCSTRAGAGMGTITTRRRKDGTEAHTAQIRIKSGGRIIHSEAQTFERLAAAKLWLKKREAELAEPGALEKAKQKDPTLAEVIDQYVRESKRDIGKTKTQVLRTIKASDLGGLKCSEIDSPAVVSFAQSLKVQPQTVGNYLAHLSAVATVARPAWGYPLDDQAVKDARIVSQRLGMTARSRQRDRRPTLAELDQLLAHYAVMEAKRSDALPMRDLILFAIFSTRRQEEITRLAVADLDVAHSEIWVRDMKHPGEKVGNDARLMLPPRALAIAQKRLALDAKAKLLFPFNADSISTSFTRACAILGIEDLHFHDLRHEGISHLFELGWNIPKVAMVSGHRTWTSLKRYTHMRQVGNKYEGWSQTPPVVG